jgi:subtilase family serine protease
MRNPPVRSIVASRSGVGVVTAIMTMSGLAAASPRGHLTPDLRVPGAPPTAAVCSTGEIRCLAHIRITEAGEIDAAAAPMGYGPAELQSAYQLDPANAPANAPTIAIVDAFGYPNLESDLATYRAQFGLPPCTVASGCLKIVNQSGATSPLPPEGPPAESWTIETALDVDVASAMCPRCKLLVVQSDDTAGLFAAQNTAAAAKPTVISDSWGAPAQATDDLSMVEPFFDHPGIAQFVAAGDHGYDDTAPGGGNGPFYPGTSAHVIAVGGTALVPAQNARGWSETAWTNGGSACSFSIPKPAYQTKSPCMFRASADISAVGDPATGVAIYNKDASGGWAQIGGTSAAAPIVAALFASIGRGDVTAAQIAQSTSSLFDVTSGTNGTCGNILCNATTGWDGPTGYGTPSAALLSGTSPPPNPGTLAVMITSPADGASVDAGFQVMATASSSAVVVGLFIDGTLLRTATAPPYVFATPTSLGFGTHDLQVVAQDAQKNQVVSEIRVSVRFGGGPVPPSDPETGNGGGCRVGGDPAPGALGLALVAGVLVQVRRRRRA